MNKSKKKYIYWLLVLLALFVVDRVVGVVGEYMMGQIRTDKSDFAKDYYRLNKDTSDVVIVGSSRAAHHYVTSILHDSIASYTGKTYSVYNAGVDGCYINSSLCVLNSIVDRYRPKLIILDTYNPEFWPSNAKVNLEASITSYSVNPYIKNCLDDLGWKERCKCLSSMYRYNQKLIQIVSLFVKKSGVSDGYIPLAGNNIVRNVTSQEVQSADDYTISHFRSTMMRMQSLTIPIIVVGSPCYKPQNNNEFVSSLCEELGVMYADYYSINEFEEHPELFYNDNHLNDIGARVFSSRLFQAIRSLL